MMETTNAVIRTMETPVLDGVFVMGDGFALNSPNKTFAGFFRE